MHYYGTYVIARAAGLPIDKARIIAYSAQYVDDSTDADSEVNADGGMFMNIATAHTNAQATFNAVAHTSEQRLVWVPFHFYPGGEGDSIFEKLICRKDSAVAREMVAHHIQQAVNAKDSYGAALMGITCHVYADTFSHYGFSGVSSSLNEIDADSFELEVEDPAVKAYVMTKLAEFFTKYGSRSWVSGFQKLASMGASTATGALGHGAVGTYPDRPFLKWRFRYMEDELNTGEWRENQKTFLEGCEKLHAALSAFGKQSGWASDPVEFANIRDTVAGILAKEGNMAERTAEWQSKVLAGEIYPVADKQKEIQALDYDHSEWEQEKERFSELSHSDEIIGSAVYQFHQAAAYHRNYTLRHLLPNHGILAI